MVGKKNDEQWKQRLKELKAYKKKHGDCLVPYRCERNAKLGYWVGTQRQQYKKWLNGVYSTITQERIDQLNEINFVWEVGRGTQKDDTVWKQRLKELKIHKKKYGDCRVPFKYEHNKKLGIWVGRQRQYYKKWLRGVHTSITQERIDQLNEIDFVWEVAKGGSQKDDALWKQRLKELKAYKKKYGDCLVPKTYEQNAKLGIWVSNQRAEYKKWLNGVYSKITQERIDQLNEIDFVWDARFERDANKSKQESSIPSVARHHVASTKTKSNQQRKRQIPSKDRPKKRQRRQSKNIVRELSSRERRERRRFVLQALYNCRNPMQPDEVVSL